MSEPIDTGDLPEAAPVTLVCWRVDPGLPLPDYQTVGAVGFDLRARLDTPIAPGAIELVPVNVIAQVPVGFVLLITARSSLPRSLGLIMPHGVGVIDCDYCGPDDEIKVQLMNVGEARVTVNRGDRIAQGLLLPVWKPRLEDKTGQPNPHATRGGHGSTGGYTSRT